MFLNLWCCHDRRYFLRSCVHQESERWPRERNKNKDRSTVTFESNTISEGAHPFGSGPSKCRWTGRVERERIIRPVSWGGPLMGL